MRPLLGTLLMLSGALFFSAGTLGWIYASLTALLAVPDLRLPVAPEWLLIGAGIVLGLLSLIVVGHLMVLFGMVMADPVRPPFPSTRPVAWFLLKTLQQLGRCTLAAAALTLPAWLLVPGQSPWPSLAGLATALVVGPLLPPLKRHIDTLEI